MHGHTLTLRLSSLLTRTKKKNLTHTHARASAHGTHERAHTRAHVSEIIALTHTQTNGKKTGKKYISSVRRHTATRPTKSQRTNQQKLIHANWKKSDSTYLFFFFFNHHPFDIRVSHPLLHLPLSPPFHPELLSLAAHLHLPAPALCAPSRAKKRIL